MNESWLEIYSFVPGKFTVLPSVNSKLTVDRVLLVLSARIFFFFLHNNIIGSTKSIPIGPRDVLRLALLNLCAGVGVAG